MIKKDLIKASERVFDEIGAYHTESIYHHSLEIELSSMGLTVSSEARVPVYYKKEMVGWAQPDMIVSNDIRRALIELKVRTNPENSLDQLSKYKKASKRDINSKDINCYIVISFNESGVEVVEG